MSDSTEPTSTKSGVCDERLSHTDDHPETVLCQGWVRNVDEHNPVLEDALASLADNLRRDKYSMPRPPGSILSNWSPYSDVSSSLVIIHHGSVPRGVNIESVHNSRVSSGDPGPGYLSGKALKWFGEKVIKILEDSIIVNRTHWHMAWLRQLEKKKISDMGEREHKRLFKVLEDALEMSRPNYPSWINKWGTELGNAVVAWVKGASFTTDAKTACWARMLHISASSLYLASFMPDHHDEDLISNLRECLTKVPLAVQDTEATTSSVICLIADELAHARYSIHHELYGEHLARIIHMTLKARPLMLDERNAIRRIAGRRLAQSESHGNSPQNCRPWEVVIFAECAGQDPILAEVAKGPRGIPGLLQALAALLSSATFHVELELMERMVWVLRHLLGRSHAALVGKLDPMIMRLLLKVLSQTVSQPGVLLACWTLDTIQNVVAHQPELLKALMNEDGITVLQHLASTRSLGPGDASSFFDQRRISTAASAKKLLDAVDHESLREGHRLDKFHVESSFGEKPGTVHGYGLGKRNFGLKGLYM